MEIDYQAPPTIGRLIDSNAFIQGIIGPYGSGKSTGCVMKLIKLMTESPPSNVDGIRRSRIAIVRNTTRMLRDTTLKTVHEWMPPGALGRWRKTEGSYYIRFNDVESEWMFRPLDSPEDVGNLLSLELTHAWLNEFREIHAEIFRNLFSRVGRYPRKNSTDTPPEFCIVMDSNPPNRGGFWYQVLEGEILGQLQSQVHLGIKLGDRPLIETFKQPSGLSDRAENTENLPDGYYERQLLLNEDKSPDWVKVHIHGEYGSDFNQMPVYQEFRRDLHVGQFQANPAKELILGFDYGRTPACVVMQRSAEGRWLILAEYFLEGVAFNTFLDYVMPSLKQQFPHHENYVAIGDPSGAHRSQADDQTCVAIAKTYGLMIRPGPQDLQTRIGSVRKSLVMLLPDGKPALMLDEHCKVLIAGFLGGYVYHRSSTQELKPEPYKDRHSHLQDCVQYVLGYYEGPTLTGGKTRDVNSRRQPVVIPMQKWKSIYGQSANGRRNMGNPPIR